MDDLCSLRVVGGRVDVIDQTLLPHQLQWLALESLPDYLDAISRMVVRGAPLIGVTAAFGLACALGENASGSRLAVAKEALLATRPTAVNLRWALDRVEERVLPLAESLRGAAAFACARELRRDDIDHCSRIGDHGLDILARLRGSKSGGPLNIMTHCNAGWLATIEWGTALAPLYKAHRAGMAVHVWVSETRPRNQGASLTAWELQQAGVPCTVVADNSCGHLMQQGLVDCVIVGSDRTAANGDVANKVGTYMKALAARANNVPFYVALPVSTIDWHCATGAAIPIEQRDSAEVLTSNGLGEAGRSCSVQLAPAGSRAVNPAFDVTPAALVSALITERGVIGANAAELARLGPG